MSTKVIDNRFARRGPQSNRIQPEVPAVDIDPLYASRLERTNRSFAKYGMSYYPSTYVQRLQDMREVYCQNYMKMYPKSTEVQLISLKRVLLKPNQFEDENGDTKKGVRSALVIKVSVKVYEPQSYDLGAKVPLMLDDLPAVGTECTFTIGNYRSPVTKPVMNKSTYPPSVSHYEVDNYEWKYYLDDSPAQIHSIIKRFGDPIKTFTVSTTNLQNEAPYDKSYSIFSKEDFINCDPTDLINMNIQGHIRKGNTNSTIKKYREFQQKKAKLEKEGGLGQEILPINPETADFLQKHKISIDSLVDQLRLNSNNDQQQETSQKARRKPSK